MGIIKTEQLEFIFNQFDHTSEFNSFEELASGHINDTYLIKTHGKPDFVLQRINHNVFKNAPGLIQNKVAISRHLKEKLGFLPKQALRRRVLDFINTKTDEPYYQDKDGN